MATIRISNNESVYKIENFLGLNENPDGDTKLKLGESSQCVNWKVTRDRNLQRRPGSKTLFDLGTNAPVMGIWYGTINEVPMGLAASGNHLWKIYEDDHYLAEPYDLGKFDTTRRVNFFAYSNIVYMLNGEEYMQYDGVEFKLVPGYRPLIATSSAPSGADRVLLEEVNKLNGLRRVWFSPDGESDTYQLPETDLMTVDYVSWTADGAYIPKTAYSVNRLAGTVTFNFGQKDFEFEGDGITKLFLLPTGDAKYMVTIVSVKVNDVDETGYVFDKTAQSIEFNTAPADEAEIAVKCNVHIATATNTIEIGYAAPANYRTDVSKMTNAELFLGSQDNAVFLYGNGTNKAVYSSIDYWGVPRADYFPDLNEMAVADSNTPITSLIRHYSQMLCFKTNSAFSVQYGTIQTAQGDAQWGFYVNPINRSIGNSAVGQVRLVLNSPRTLFGNDMYEWKNTSSYSSNLTVDERQAKRISDRIYNTLTSFDLEKCYCYDDNDNQEYYCCFEDKALVHNYAADAWYFYTGLDINTMCNLEEDVLFGTSNGKIKRLSTDYYNDDGKAYESKWVSGSIDFGKNYMRKLMSEIWVSTKPQESSKVTITVQTDKKSEYTEKTIESFLSSFAHLDFGDISFNVNRKPQVKKLKIKAKKFSFLRIMFRSDDAYTTATVLSADPKIRETGYAK